MDLIDTIFLRLLLFLGVSFVVLHSILVAIDCNRKRQQIREWGNENPH